MAPKIKTSEQMAVLIEQRVEKTDDGCWVWQGGIRHDGYGRLVWPDPAKKEVVAHRVSFRVFRGPIPEGLQLDHLCRVRACVNPDHLDPVTGQENLRRSPITVAATNAAKTHCPQGHEYTHANTYIKPARGQGRRTCRACQRAAVARYKTRKAAA